MVIRFQIMCTTSQLLGVKIKLKPVSFRGLRPLDPRKGALPLDPAGGSAPWTPARGSAPWTPDRGLCPLDPRQGALPHGPPPGAPPLDPRSLRSQAREKSSFPCPPLARGLVTPLPLPFFLPPFFPSRSAVRSLWGHSAPLPRLLRHW